MNLGAASIAVQMMARSVTLLRRTGSYAGGVYQLGDPQEIAVSAVIQNASQDDLRILPEGERTEGYVTIWATVALRASSEVDGTPTDVIRSETGEEFRAVSVGARPEGGFWRCIGRKVEGHGR